jgi:hypothetical protein
MKLQLSTLADFKKPVVISEEELLDKEVIIQSSFH